MLTSCPSSPAASPSASSAQASSPSPSSHSCPSTSRPPRQELSTLHPTALATLASRYGTPPRPQERRDRRARRPRQDDAGGRDALAVGLVPRERGHRRAC